MLRMGHKSCFVCDSTDLQGGIVLSIEKTLFSNTDFPSKICQIIGERFLVIVDPLDQLCINCALLINKSDKLETKLMEIKDEIAQYLCFKYNLDQELDEDYSITRDFEPINEGADCRSPRIDDESTLCSDITSNEEMVDKKDHDFALSSFDSQDKNRFNVKEEPLNSTWPEECLNGNNQHECLDLASSPCLGDFVADTVSEQTTCDETAALQMAMSGKMEIVEDITEDRLREIKKELYVNITESSCLISPSEGICPSKSIKLNCVTSYSPSTESNLLDINNTLDRNQSAANMLLIVTKQENSAHCEADGSNLNGITSESNPPKPEKFRPPRKKRDRAFNGYQQKKLRPILPKLTNIVHSYCVLDLNRQDTAQPSEVCFESGPLTTRPGSDISSKPCATISETAQADASEQLQCRVCSLQFEDLESFKAHKKAHAGDVSKHECGVCKRIYKTRSGLQNHQAKHTGRYTFYCEVCGAGFMTQWGLTEHSGSHLKNGRYTCQLCDKRFAYQSSFWIHKKWHENPMPYRCGECGLPFRHSSHLANHRRSRHSGERPYRCRFCPSTFVYSTSFRRHEILHTKKFPFSCAVCQQGFTTRFKYSEHLNSAHGVALEQAGCDFKVALGVSDQSRVSQKDAKLLPSSVESNNDIVKVVLGSPLASPDSFDSWLSLQQ